MCAEISCLLINDDGCDPVHTRAKRIQPLPDWLATLVFYNEDDSDMHDAKIEDISSSGCRLSEIDYRPFGGQLVYFIFTSDDGIYTLRAKVVKLFGPMSAEDHGVKSDIAIHFESATDEVGEFTQNDIDQFLEYITRYAPGEEEWIETQDANLH